MATYRKSPVKKGFTLLLLAFLMLLPVSGQEVQLDPVPTTDETELTPFKQQEIETRLKSFISEINKVKRETERSLYQESLDKANRKLSAIDIRWNVYYQMQQPFIGQDEQLVELVTHYQQRKQEVTDLITAKQHYVESMHQFSEADRFLSAQDTLYKQMLEQALEFSLVKQLAPKLDELKGKEQLLFADIQKYYDTAKAVSEEFSGLQMKMNKLEEHYIQLKNLSGQIQACEYKPLFDRIKDYLFGLAAVALILMFANMIQAKIKMAKQAKEALQKQKELMGLNNSEYPTI
ncbi:MAG: hypothetical protein ACI30I_04395 [Parabacteroides sp.]